MQKSRLKRAYFKEFGEKKCKLASTSATGVVVIVGSEETVTTSTEGEEKDDPENAAPTTIIGIIV